MENEFNDIEQEELYPKKEDWHIKDNLTQALNLINRDRLTKNYMAKLMSYQKIENMAKEICQRDGCSMLDASIKLKEKAKKDHQKLKNKK